MTVTTIWQMSVHYTCASQCLVFVLWNWINHYKDLTNLFPPTEAWRCASADRVLLQKTIWYHIQRPVSVWERFLDLLTFMFQEAIGLVTRVFEHLLKVVTLIGVTILVFGYAYSFLLLDLYGGTLLSSGTGWVGALALENCLFLYWNNGLTMGLASLNYNLVSCCRSLTAALVLHVCPAAGC